MYTSITLEPPSKSKSHAFCSCLLYTSYMDIDYMQAFKDFTVSEENFPDFPEFVQEMADQDIRLIPIIDAGVKVEPGYEIYEEGVKNNYFCKREDGPFAGRSHK